MINIMSKKLLRNKKGWLLRDFVIVGLMFSLVAALFVIVVASTADSYGNTDIINPQFAEHYDKLSTNLEQLNTANQAVQGTGGLNLIGAFNVAFNSVFTVIVMVWDGLLVYTSMASNIAGDFSFLDQGTILMFLTAIIAMLTAYLIFVWLSSVSRGKI